MGKKGWGWLPTQPAVGQWGGSCLQEGPGHELAMDRGALVRGGDVLQVEFGPRDQSWGGGTSRGEPMGSCPKTGMGMAGT